MHVCFNSAAAVPSGSLYIHTRRAFVLYLVGDDDFFLNLPPLQHLLQSCAILCSWVTHILFNKLFLLPTSLYTLIGITLKTL